MTILSGPAGVGKSSLLAACQHELDSRPDVYALYLGQVSGGSSFPLGVHKKYNPYSLALLRSWSGLPATHLVDFTMEEFVGQRALERDERVVILAAIDHADDLFTGPESRQQDGRRFLHDLTFVLDEHPRLHLLISARPDVQGRLRDALGGVARCEDYELGPLDPEATHQAMVDTSFLPAQAAGDLLTAIRTSRVTSAQGKREQVTAATIEPALLQAACARLKETPPETRRGLSRFVTWREPHRPGDVDAALAEYCGRTVATVADMHAMSAALIRHWLIRMYASPGGPAAARPDEYPHVPDAVARALEDRHVLRRSARTPAPRRATPSQPADPRQYQLISNRLAEPLQLYQEDISALADPGAHLKAAGRALTTGEFELAEEYVAAALRAAQEEAVRGVQEEARRAAQEEARRAAQREALQAAQEKLYRLQAEASTLLGNLACERRELDEAEKHYQKAAEHFEAAGDNNAVACLLAAVGRTLTAQHKLPEAFEKLKAAISRNPTDPVIQDELTWTMDVLFGRAADPPPFRLSPG